MSELKSLKAKSEDHPQFKTPRLLYDIKEETDKNDPRDIAEALLKKITADIDVDPDPSRLKFDCIRESILGYHVLFQQYYNGIPISDAWIRIFLNKDKKISQILNDLIPERILNETVVKASKEPKLSEKEAIELVQKKVTDENKHAGANTLKTEQVYFIHAGIPTLAWKVIVGTAQPARKLKFYVNADDGKILYKSDLFKYVFGKGRIFNPNPVVTLNDTSLKDTSVIPDGAYSDVLLNDLDPGGFLDGPFVSTSDTMNRIKKDDNIFLFKRDDRAFKEVMVYFHIDQVQRYIQSLGFDNVCNRQIQVNVGGIPDDNSFYDTEKKSLTFGRGGVDDAEDAEIIIHEYGHAIQDDQLPGFGASYEAAAMGEGFSDYLAGSFFADLKSDILKPCIGSWDAPPYLRRLDSTKKYPEDMVWNWIHEDGKIWSACLWELRQLVGRKAADQLAIAHHFLISRAASFKDSVNALITADEILNQGRNKTVIQDIFTRRGIIQKRDDANIIMLNSQVNLNRLNLAIYDLVNFETRYCRSSKTYDVQDWIYKQFVDIGYAEVTYQDAGLLGNISQRNILCYKGNGRNLILLCAHYDSISESPFKSAPGADDNASGIAAMLEIARLLKNVELKCGLIFAAFAGEEEHFFGSKAFAELTEHWPINVVINMDMISYDPNNAKQVIVEYDQGNENPYNDAAAKSFALIMAQAAEQYTTLEVTHSNIVGSDYMPFEAKGFPCIGVYESMENPYYHTSNDKIHQVNIDYLREVVKALLSTVLILGQ